MCAKVKCWASCPESSLWIQGEPLMGLLSGRLGVIADNAKWEMGNAANKGKIQSGTQRWAYVIYCSTCAQKAWHWAVSETEIINKCPIVALKLFFFFCLHISLFLYFQPSTNSFSLPSLLFCGFVFLLPGFPVIPSPSSSFGFVSRLQIPDLCYR